VTDNCEIVAKLPEMLGTTPASYCHSVTPFLTQVKLLSSYTIPKANVLVSGTYQSIPGPALTANRTYTSAEIAPSLGRSLSAGATSTDTINLIAPGAQYGERINQLDFRVGKVLKYHGSRTTVSFDLYNLTNSDTVITENTSYTTAGVWRVPTSTIQARLAKISLQWDF
jgi:hypothetical protein